MKRNNTLKDSFSNEIHVTKVTAPFPRLLYYLTLFAFAIILSRIFFQFYNSLFLVTAVPSLLVLVIHIIPALSSSIQSTMVNLSVLIFREIDNLKRRISFSLDGYFLAIIIITGLILLSLPLMIDVLSNLLYGHIDINEENRSVEYLIPVLATLIPLSFAATAFMLNQIYQRVPAVIARTALSFINKSIWLLLSIVFFVGLLSPAFQLDSRETYALQTILTLLSFSLTIAYAWGMFKYADTSYLIPKYCRKAQDRIEKLASDYITSIPKQFSWRNKFFGAFTFNPEKEADRLVSKALGYNFPDTCERTAIESVETILILLERCIREDTVSEALLCIENISQLSKVYFHVRNRFTRVKQVDPYSMYLTNELLRICSESKTPKYEKFLDTIAEGIQLISLATCEKNHNSSQSDSNYLCTPWAKSLSQLAFCPQI